MMLYTVGRIIDENPAKVDLDKRMTVAEFFDESRNTILPAEQT
jgi:hypothetical protein